MTHEDNEMTRKRAEEWRCYMFGNRPDSKTGMVYFPWDADIPNWFVRWMMKICFACTWVKVEQKEQK